MSSFRTGDGVLLSRKDSAQYLAVKDLDGCQIQIHGVIKELRGDRALVRVLVELYRGIVGVLHELPLEDLTPATGVRVWNKRNAHALDRQRRDMPKYWAD